MSLKNQAINAVVWNSIGNFTTLGIEFVIGIILARLLAPQEFGLMATIMIVINISQIFINSGFSQAIVRKPTCTQDDYSTAFYFNLAAGTFLFGILLITAGPISRFFSNPELKPLIQVLGTVLIIGSLSLIQQAKLTRKIDFKLQSKVTITASVISGLIAIVLAVKGFGVWSLVVKTLANQCLTTVMLWFLNPWKPDLIFNMESFRELFGFGSKLLISGIIGSVLSNLYYLVIAKYYTPADLGYYSRAELFKNLPSQNATSVITSVSYPVLAKVQGDRERFREGSRKIITTTFFIMSILMFGMAAVSDSLILTLVGEQWKQSVIYLQLLCFVGLMHPLTSININLLNVIGRSDLYMKLQLIMQSLSIPVMVTGIFFGIRIMIFAMWANYLISFIIYSWISSRYTGYAVKTQIRDISWSFILGLVMGVLVYLVDFFTSFNPLATLLIQLFAGVFIVIIAGELFKLKEYLFLKEIILGKTRSLLFNPVINS
jgi:teichuronic acid exporter